MGSVHNLFLDPTSPEGIAGVGDFLRSVLGSNETAQLLHIEQRAWGQAQVMDMLAVVTIADAPVTMRVLYRIVRAEPLELSVWFDDPQHHGRELVVYTCAAAVKDPKPPPSLPFTRR